MKSESGKDIARWINLVDRMLSEGDEQTDAQKEAAKKAEKNNMNIERLTKDILEQKFELLNAKIEKMYRDRNPETPETDMMRFDFVDKGDHYEFTMPINVLFGPRTRKECANYWDDFFESCDIRTSFLDNINEAVDKINNIHLTMKLVVKDGKVQEK